MKEQYNFFNDRRSKIRKPYKGKVTFRLNELVNGYGYTKDINIGAICVTAPELFAFFTHEQSNILHNLTLEVSFLSEPIKLQGTIIRVNAVKKELVIKISQNSNPEKWMWLCK